MSKYIKLDIEAIRRDFPEVYADWESTHEVTPKIGKWAKDYPFDSTRQIIVSGFNSEFHFLLTKR